MKTRIYLFAFLLLLPSLATTTPAAAKNMTREQTEVRIMEIKQRVDDIRTMDLSHLNKTERKGLKQELKDMNKELKSLSPVIYISVGTLIIIILLLILLL
jgi:endo-alpha-1,4-polygalactosaminidase (GH114 family)